MKYTSPLALFTAVVFASSFTASAEDSYLVPIDRAAIVGTSTNLIIEGAEAMKMSIILGGKTLKEQEEAWKSTLEVNSTVDKVDAKGNSTNLTLLIKKFTIEEKGKTIEALEKGTVVKASREGDKDVFTVNDKAVSEDVYKVLNPMIDLGADENGDENKSFGVDKPRKAGEKWDIDVDALIVTMSKDMPFDFNKDNTKGKMHFVQLSGSGANKLATLQGNIEMEIKGMKDMPPGTETGPSSIQVSLNGDFPVDATKPLVNEDLSMKVNFNGKIPTPDGQKADMKMSGLMARKTKQVP